MDNKKIAKELVSIAKELTAKGDTIEKLRDIVERRQYKKIDGMVVDMFTASAIMQVYDALSPANQENFAKKPIKKMVKIAWKLLKQVNV